MLTDVAEPQYTDAERDARVIRREIATLTGHARHVLSRVRQLVADPDHRQAVAAELGGADAQALRDAYQAYRQAVQAADGVDVGALPA
mgnify:CR=1 FL=1